MPPRFPALAGADRFLVTLAEAPEPLVLVEPPTRGADEGTLLEATEALLNALLTVEQNFALILENYHVIASPAVHAAVALMVEYPPLQRKQPRLTRTVFASIIGMSADKPK